MNIRWGDLESSAKILLFSNLITIGIVLIMQWSIFTLLFGYWLQSLIIGFFTILKLMMFGDRDKQHGHLLIGVRNSVFFTLHYGFFHFVYVVFLYFLSTSTQFGLSFKPPNIAGILFIGSLFFVNHLYSFLKNYIWEKKIVGFASKDIFFEPYKRILPMHLTIIAAGFFSALIPTAETPLIIMFQLLKTLADLKSHQILHQSDTYRSFHH